MCESGLSWLTRGLARSHGGQGSEAMRAALSHSPPEAIATPHVHAPTMGGDVYAFGIMSE